MIRINLLPYREQLRAERRRQFGFFALFALALGAVVAFFGHMLNAADIDRQEARNRYLDAEIQTLDKQIVEIKSLREQLQALLKRKQIIEALQGSRNEAVMLFNELTRSMPEGVYITSLRQVGPRVTLSGYAQSDPRVAPLMRKLESLPNFTNPRLIEVKAVELNNRRLSQFTLDIDLVRTNPEENKGGGR